VISRPELVGCLGVVSSTHWLASAAGMAALEQGGNAFDAAVAAGFVLAVVEPHSNGLGGDVSILLYAASSEKVKVICGQGPIPRAATPDHFRELGLRQIPGSGLLPACVPGAFGAWLRLLAEHGTMRLSAVLDFAIGYASRGFPILSKTAQTIEALAPLFRQEWAESGRTYLQAGSPPVSGSRMCNGTLADTLRRLLREGERCSTDRETQIEGTHSAFYDGFVAETIDKFVHDTEVFDATGGRHRGLIEANDLANWRPAVEDPVSLRYGQCEVFKAGPWSQGPVFLQQLALLDAANLQTMEAGSAGYIHTLTEAAKLALADREAWYGDPRYSDVPLEELLDPSYTAERLALIGPCASLDMQPGRPAGRQSWIPAAEPDEVISGKERWVVQLQDGSPIASLATAGSGDTCTVAVADHHGNLVAAVPSGGWLKSSPVVPGLGFPLGTRGQTMWLADGHPNSLVPGKRPRTTLSPTVVLRDGEPYLAFGTPGGDQQDQWTLQAFLAAHDQKLDLQAATETTAFHTNHVPASFTPRTSSPGSLIVEDSCSPTVLTDLRYMGHQVQVVHAGSLGKVCIAGVDSATGFVHAAAGPRGRQAYAAGR